MKEFYINVNSIEKVKDFCEKANRVECDIELYSGKYVIDAKSLMGIFSLNISKPLKMVVNSDNVDISELFPYIV